MAVMGPWGGIFSAANIGLGRQMQESQFARGLELERDRLNYDLMNLLERARATQGAAGAGVRDDVLQLTKALGDVYNPDSITVDNFGQRMAEAAMYVDQLQRLGEAVPTPLVPQTSGFFGSSLPSPGAAGAAPQPAMGAPAAGVNYPMGAIADWWESKQKAVGAQQDIIDKTGISDTSNMIWEQALQFTVDPKNPNAGPDITEYQRHPEDLAIIQTVAYRTALARGHSREQAKAVVDDLLGTLQESGVDLRTSRKQAHSQLLNLIYMAFTDRVPTGPLADIGGAIGSLDEDTREQALFVYNEGMRLIDEENMDGPAVVATLLDRYLWNTNIQGLTRLQSSGKIFAGPGPSNR